MVKLLIIIIVFNLGTQPITPLNILTIVVQTMTMMTTIMMMRTMMMMVIIFPSTHRVTYAWFQPPVMTMVSPASGSGIPHAPSTSCFSSNLAPPVTKE